MSDNKFTIEGSINWETRVTGEKVKAHQWNRISYYEEKFAKEFKKYLSKTSFIE